MIESNWLDDKAATRMLNVMEERCFELSNTTDALNGLIERYFSPLYVEEERQKCAKQASADYDYICSLLHMVRNVLLDIDEDFNAAVRGDSSGVKYRKAYIDSIIEPSQEAVQ